MNTAAAPDILAIGEPVPLGVVPRHMHCWAIRADRHGPPATSFRQEVVEIPKIGDDDVLILVMAAGVNFNGVWAALGRPISPIALHGHAVHVAGSDAAGIVWQVGRNVSRWRPGDQVVVQCAQVDGNDEECNGGDPLLSPSQRIWGYETPDGSFAQFARVQQTQLLPRPLMLSWEESACYLLTLATTWRMLFGHQPHVVKPGMTVLVWGAAGGLGCMALQLCVRAGAYPIAIVSSPLRADYVRRLGAVGVIDRREFQLGKGAATDEIERLAQMKAMGRAIRALSPGGRDVDIVIEHPGRDTFALSTFLVRPGGMVVFCAATSGHDFSFDARHVWMRQKRIQGSHYADLKQAMQANRLVCEGRLNPCLSQTFGWESLPEAHQMMLDNAHPPGNMAVLVQAPEPGLGRRPPSAGLEQSIRGAPAGDGSGAPIKASHRPTVR